MLNAMHTKPFHESIIDAVNDAAGPAELTVLAELVKRTSIPKGHKKIIEAFREQSEKLDWSDPEIEEIEPEE
jgi:hypothetical protein